MVWETIARYLLHGLVVTLELTVVGFIGGFALGFLLAVARTYGGKLSKALSTAYIELIRGTPMLLQLYIIGFGLPLVIRNYFPHFVMNPTLAAALGMVINSAAYQAEYIRGAFNSVEYGQVEAALSLGMTKWGIIRHVIFPQAFRIMLPSWTNEMVYLLKYSSLAMLLAVPELMYQASVAASQTFLYAQIYLVVAGIYLVFATLIIGIMRKIELRLHIPGVTTIKR
ncbi:amino acid ABC transporter permease [Thermococcus sp. AM4]|uniref:amino acid ABC transporter permease n=1 Tax=Thermococcus sp. (strain AM4) TaxID=246969 RepID=UPI0001871359|nr:amino acid ABC transporter permease [Thermococcus sp. AM4]EEB73706.1 polar amino acid ABC transporter, permease component [Thermococcus sp. AM4]